MTAVWIAVAALTLLVCGLASILVRRARGRHDSGRPAKIENLTDATVVDPGTGAVTSVQRADLLIEPDALTEIWTPMHLERLARTYWRFLTRVTLGLIRVRYGAEGRSIVLLTAPLRLLSFAAPEYEMDASRGLVRWRITKGLLVARQGRNGDGYLQIEVLRTPEEKSGRVTLHVEVEVANFYPSISGLSLRLYNATQSRIHVIVTYAFLRSLARLDLAESRVGQLGSG
jgi:hypothetical protein